MNEIIDVISALMQNEQVVGVLGKTAERSEVLKLIQGSLKHDEVSMEQFY